MNIITSNNYFLLIDDSASIDDICPSMKEFTKLRSVFAYVYLMAYRPTHLGRRMANLVRTRILITRLTPYHSQNNIGVVQLAKLIYVEWFEIESHPMVLKTRELLAQGFKRNNLYWQNGRRQYGKVFLHRVESCGRVTRYTVLESGAVRDGWMK